MQYFNSQHMPSETQRHTWVQWSSAPSNQHNKSRPEKQNQKKTQQKSKFPLHNFCTNRNDTSLELHQQVIRTFSNWWYADIKYLNQYKQSTEIASLSDISPTIYLTNISLIVSASNCLLIPNQTNSCIDSWTKINNKPPYLLLSSYSNDCPNTSAMFLPTFQLILQIKNGSGIQKPSFYRRYRPSSRELKKRTS